MEISTKDLRPLADLKHKTDQLLKHLKTTRRPILLVKNGKPAAILVGPKEFADGLGAGKLARMLRQAESEMAEGKGRDINEFFTDFAKAHNL